MSVQRQRHAFVSCALLLGVALSGCLSAEPRFPADVQRALSRDEMRRMETDSLVVYYPEGSREATLRAAARLESCKRAILDVAPVKDGPGADKSVVVMPRLPFNNAFQAGANLGFTPVVLVPQYNTAEFFMTLGLLPDPALIACHEMIHLQGDGQVNGLAGGLRSVFGALYEPNDGLDSWWQEGVAVYYESRLQGVGRLRSPYFSGHFAAGLQDISSLHGGYLNRLHRSVPYGANYLVGAHFVEYLARTYGEEKLWQLTAEQSDSLPGLHILAISGEFSDVYGKSLARLIKDFEVDARRRYPSRQREAGQRSLATVGQSALYARSPSGREALLTEDLDDPPRLTIREADGTMLSSRRLTDIFFRRLIAPAADLMSGLSLTRDGAHAYFVAVDAGAVFSEARLMHLDIAKDELAVVKPDLEGSGGSISPDGAHYYFSRATGGGLNPEHALFRLELASGEVVQLSSPAPRHYQLAPVASPDGKRLLVTEGSDAGVRLAIYDATTGQRLSSVAAPPGYAAFGSWADDAHVVYSGTADERLDVFETDLESQRYRRITRAPYLAFRPYSDGKSVRFLNREGWRWTLDEVAQPERTAATQPARPALTAPQLIAPQLTAPQLTAAQFTASARAAFPEGAVADRAPNIISDTEYSSFDGLFVPRAWWPHLILHGEGQFTAGLTIAGNDRLEQQRYALFGGWDTQANLPSVNVSYYNAMLAPALLSIRAGYTGSSEKTLDDFEVDQPGRVQIEEKNASVRLGTTLYQSYSLGIGGRYEEARYERESSGELLRRYRLVGPGADFAFDAGEATAYAGPRLAFGIGAGATYFPEAASTVGHDLTDVAMGAGLVLPLPLSRRHTLALRGRAHALIGAQPGEDLLQVGGTQPVFLQRLRGDEEGSDVLPPSLRFEERLRGFEGSTLFGRRVMIGEARYTYPFIIDWGTASTMWLLPSSFLRQINFDLFFSAADLLEQGREVAAAAGAALIFDFSLWNATLPLTVQGARHLSYDEAWVLYLAFGIDAR